MSSWLFPPQTREVQLDEKWDFVGKKQARCDPGDPADARRGDCWDHVALDTESRLVLAVVAGKRTEEHTRALVEQMKRRTGGKPPRLIMSDEYRPYRTALLEAYGREVTPPRTGKRGRPRSAYKVAPRGLRYAVVHKTRKKGRVVKIEERVIFGSQASVEKALKQSKASRKINTAFVERHNGTDRHRCSRKARRSYRFSKDWEIHEAATCFSMYSYNFCWPVRTLRRKVGRAWRRRTPAMAAELTDHVWTLCEWLSYPAVQRE